jgi:hypothetical protein
MIVDERHASQPNTKVHKHIDKHRGTSATRPG